MPAQAIANVAPTVGPHGNNSMCGIAGLLDTQATIPPHKLADTVQRMADAVRHRGPDDRGHFVDNDARIALGHRRLSIIDLSDAGRQPMQSNCARFTIVFNGEIYNYTELQARLESGGQKFQGHSDTRVLVNAIAEWGLEGALREVNGMFALAVWNHETRTLSLARDRIGIKPLYYGWCGRAFVFGSELKALRAFPGFNATISRQAVAQYVQHSYVPEPLCIYESLRKLPPGTTLSVTRDTMPFAANPESWWSLNDAIVAGQNDPARSDPHEAADLLETELRASVRRRMISDVPLGAFLSGGIDSSAIVALMQQEASQPVRTFTIGFHEDDYNEAQYAAAVARHLKTEHVEHYVAAAEARDVIPLLPTMFDEPFADSSQIPTFLVAQLARKHVTVALSGDGGDELFGGYSRYRHIDAIRRKTQWLPLPLRRLAGNIVPLIRKLSGRTSHGSGVWREVLSCSNNIELYRSLHRHWKDPQSVVKELTSAGPLTEQFRNLPTDPIEQMMAVDTVTYLPGDILTKVDRATMAVGLEARVPLLDHRVVELAWRMPADVKFNRSVGKLVLRNVLQRSVPAEMFDRPKTGFGIPIDSWLRDPLRDWAENLLSHDRLAADGWFRPDVIRDRWQQHLDGTCDWHYLLWDILMFQAWLDAA